GNLLGFTPVEIQDLRDKIDKAAGFQPVQVADGLDYDTFAAVSVRLPDLHGVVPQRGFSRYYPTGPAVGHLIGYVGAASREEYEAEPSPLLLTPGFKLGKDGLEKQFEQVLRGRPGARRSEVTARGRIVRDLETREDVQGRPIQLTIDGPLQDYAARRIGLESGSVVVMDCVTGELLCMASMPSFDPNSFSDGIGRVEYQMLSENERVPLRNKVLKGLYPPGSTVKPMHAMAFLKAASGPRVRSSAAAGCGSATGSSDATPLTVGPTWPRPSMRAATPISITSLSESASIGSPRSPVKWEWDRNSIFRWPASSSAPFPIRRGSSAS